MEGERNVVSGNLSEGIAVWGQSTMSNTVIGNYVGVDVSGLHAVGNRYSGLVFAAGASYDRAERNVVSGNLQHGIGLWDAGVTNNVMVGNLIGLGADGKTPVGNHNSGIMLTQGAQNNRIGGTTLIERNVIGDNLWDGIGFWGEDVLSNTVVGNYIGLDATGFGRVGNHSEGVALKHGARHNRIGGWSAAERNVIGGNVDGGIGLVYSNTVSNTIVNNFIGVGADGLTAVGNRYGITCLGGAQLNLFLDNVIGGSVYDGVHFDGCSRNTLTNNNIGLAADGATPIPNGESGISLFNGAQSNEIGTGNRISVNKRRGVSVWDATSLYNRVTRNAIYGNGGQGIDNGNGGNAGLPGPVVISMTSGSAIGVAPAAGATIELFSDLAGQGQVFEGATTTDANGAFVFTGTKAFYGPHLTLTVIDSQGNTSGFSAAFQPPAPACLSRAAYVDLQTQAWSQYPDDSQLRAGILASLLDQTWEMSSGGIGLVWFASISNPKPVVFGYDSVVWTTTGGYNPLPDPVGAWAPEPGFAEATWGTFRASGRMQMRSSGHSARLCRETQTSPVTALAISGPSSGAAGSAYGFNLVATPVTATQPLTILWQASEQPASTRFIETGVDDRVAYAWAKGGVKWITATTIGNGSPAVIARWPITLAEAAMYSSNGYAVSTAFTPTELIGWEGYTLTLYLPPGTSAQATIMAPSFQPLPGLTNLALSNGVTPVNLRGVNSLAYPSLRLRVDMTTTNPLILPRLVDWRLNWRSNIPPGDDYESDNNCATATPLQPNQPAQAHNFHRAGDEDWVRFEVLTSTNYLLVANNLGAQSMPGFSVRQMCNLEVAVSPAPFGGEVSLPMNNYPPGSYYVRVTNTPTVTFGANTGYDLSLRAESANPTAIIVAGHNGGLIHRNCSAPVG